MEIEVNVHNQEIVSLCDSDLIGKTLQEGELEFIITERFYKGDKLKEKEIIELLKKVSNINIVGDKAIKLALKAKVITKEGIRKIQDVPIAQMYSVI
ncbi:MAG: DUF424 family protein [Nanoarchaeota archaeon]|nr:DUF424 family protein [Nanoarchaeota archaeon]MBU4352356.1 DUF424 family protein [Nanoarchaeota archaeon]MBU4456267.1 DUF424 family protein [Nanoarchaeota archaeon]MCG2720382.1 DUF424 family protein [Nanoarchaeota archaeon]